MPDPTHRAGRKEIDTKSRSLPQGKSYFLGIGIDAYEHFSKLNNAVRDVQAVAELLIAEYDLEREHCTLLLNEKASRRGILRALRQMGDTVSETDKLIIYYSGHGHLNRRKRGFWIPHNADSGEEEDFVANARLRELISDIPARHVLLISDACFAGSFFVRSATRADVVAEELESIPSRWALCSGRHDELVADGPAGNHSPFAESILTELGRNQQPQLRIGSLADRVIELTRANYDQLPEGNPIQGVGHKGGQYIFRRRASEDGFWERANASNTVGAYLDYREKYPNGKYVEEAEKRILQLDDDNAWAAAQQTNTVSAYLSYQRRFPQGKYGEQARQALQDLRLQEDFNRLCFSDDQAGIRRFIAIHPESSHVEHLKERLRVLEQQHTPNKKVEGPKADMQALKKGKLAAVAKPPENRQEPKIDLKKGLLAGTALILLVLLIIWQPWRADQTTSPLEHLADTTHSEKNVVSPPTSKTDNKDKKPITPAFIAPEMVSVPGGTFLMGCSTEARDGDCSNDEEPAHEVSLKTFSIGKYEVTNAEFVAFLKAEKNQIEGGVSWYDMYNKYARIKEVNGSFQLAAGYDRHPVAAVSWYGARAYAKWLSRISGENYRLPTEAEWEYAARGGKSGIKDQYLYSGSNTIAEVAWYNANSKSSTHAVGQKKQNQLRIHDMSGNVYEWCNDWYAKDYYQKSPQQNHKGPDTGNFRVVRGGSWRTTPQGCRAASRDTDRPTYRLEYVGFRLARS